MCPCTTIEFWGSQSRYFWAYNSWLSDLITYQTTIVWGLKSFDEQFDFTVDLNWQVRHCEKWLSPRTTSRLVKMWRPLSCGTISPDHSVCLFFGFVHPIVLRLTIQHRTQTAEKLFLDDSSHLFPFHWSDFLFFSFLCSIHLCVWMLRYRRMVRWSRQFLL
jgi:hypothetical protein